MSSPGISAEYAAALAAMDDNELRDEMFRLFDNAEAAGAGSDVAEAAESAVIRIRQLEAAREVRRNLRDAARVAMPDVDADAFVDAARALAGAQRTLGSADAKGVFAGAIEVALRRAEMNTKARNDDD